MAEPIGDALERHGIDDDRGFLPDPDPPTGFDPDRHDPPVATYLRRLDDLVADLPRRLSEGSLRPAVRDLDRPPEGLVDELDERERIRLCLVSGFLASGYVHRIGADPVDRLPAGVAVPLYRASRHLGRKPILSYDLLCLHNWRRRDPSAGLAVENLEPVERFTTFEDERWFVAIHVAIEAAAGPALVAAARAQRAVRADDPGGVRDALETVAESLSDQTAIMRRMTEGNDPETFATGFRPYYEGFDELVYEGVAEHEGTARSYRGGSGAQSSILPSVDAALGIDHESTALIEKLLDMRSYMPPAHREVIAAFDEGPDVGAYVADGGREDLRAAYNRCLDELGAFRQVHFGQVAQYIRAVTGDTTGTGGTDYMSFLPKLREETEAKKV